MAKLNPKGFVQYFLLVILLIVAAVAGYTYFSKKSLPLPGFKPPTPTPSPTTSFPPPSQVTFPTLTPDKTANWKTYTNNQYNFEFKYPPDLLSQVDIKNAYIGICNLGKAIVRLNLYPAGTPLPRLRQPDRFTGELTFDIDVEDNKDRLTPQSWVSKYCQETWPAKARQESLYVGGFPATKFTQETELPSLTILDKDGLLFFIHSSGNPELFNDILSTFRFINTK